jgi:hypothetical protein
MLSEAPGAGISSRPELLLSPDEGIIGRCRGCHFLRVGLLEESTVPMARTSERGGRLLVTVG